MEETNDNCIGCFWYLNSFCTCEGLKPCDCEKDILSSKYGEFHKDDNNSCHTCFYNDMGFCRLKYFTIYDDSYGCDLYSKVKNDNI